MWQVILSKNPVGGDYRSDFFPRKVYYKRDALRLIDEVKRNGGAAICARVSTAEQKAQASSDDVAERLFDALLDSEPEQVAALYQAISTWKTRYPRTADGLPPFSRKLIVAMEEAYDLTREGQHLPGKINDAGSLRERGTAFRSGPKKVK